MVAAAVSEMISLRMVPTSGSAVLPTISGRERPSGKSPILPLQALSGPGETRWLPTARPAMTGLTCVLRLHPWRVY